MNVRCNIAYFFLILLVAFANCMEEENSMEVPVIHRTLLFYLGGDNNLSAEVNRKVEQIQVSGFPPGSRVLVYMDTRGNRPQLREWTTMNGVQNWKTVQEYEETNSASAVTFSAVLQEVKERYSSPSYGLVVFSHASGWLPGGAYSRSAVQSRSIITDGRSEMELRDFAAAIPGGMFDFIVFETCHMAGIEVAWELKEKTKYIVASSAEIVVPGFDPAYPDALPCLMRETPDLKGFIKAIGQDYARRQTDYASLTLSLIQTHALEKLAKVVRNIDFRQLAEQVNTLPVQRYDRNGKRLYFDLVDCYRQGMSAAEADRLQEAMDEAVSYKIATRQFMPSYGGFGIDTHSGLTIYVPQNEYPKLNEAYKQLRWYKEVLIK